MAPVVLNFCTRWVSCQPRAWAAVSPGKEPEYPGARLNVLEKRKSLAPADTGTPGRLAGSLPAICVRWLLVTDWLFSVHAINEIKCIVTTLSRLIKDDKFLKTS